MVAFRRQASKYLISRRCTILPAASLGALLLACAPGDVKGGLDPENPEAVAVSVSADKGTVSTGESVVIRASARTANGQPAPAEVDWTADGGSLVPLSDSTAQFSASTAGSYKVRGRGRKSPNPQDSTVVVVTDPISPIVSVAVSPSAATLPTGSVQAFVASATRQDGTTLTPAVTWSATGGTISGSGVYTAGSTAGAYRVIAVLQGGTLADTAPVTLTAPTLQAVILTPASASLATGATQQFAVSGQWSNGATTAPAVTYSATGGTITAGGLYTAGATAGNFRVIATQQGGSLADTSAITITAPTLQAVILTPASAALATGATQQFAVSGQWSNGATTAPAVTYSATGGTITAGGLYTAGSTAGSFRVIATQQGGSLADTATVTITGGGSGGTILVTEGFEDGNIGNRGWFDVTSVATSADARPGSTGSRVLQWRWTQGMVAPQGASRVDFTPTTSVYLSYWIKQSSNWVGSGQSDHPHLFYILSTADDHWSGLSRTHLTLYDEMVYQSGRGGSYANLAIQDALMINTANLMVDLTNITENRAIGGYNGRPEPGLMWDAYTSGGLSTNYKIFRPATLIMTDATKASWHHVESYWQLNTVSGGRGQPDGVVQYWFDGALLVDRHDIYFRTAANSTMMLRTLVLGPYIGVGSPVDQTIWIDDLVIATAKP